jgi:mannonate dehydratase
MIKLSMVAVPPTDDLLATIRQIGVDNLVHYDMRNDPDKYDALEAFTCRARKFGLKVPVVESGPAIDRIVLGKDGWKAQTQQWARCIEQLGRLGVEVVCYNFMPQVLADAMVVRSDTAALTRGGALTTAFREIDIASRIPIHADAPVTFEEMQENLRRFLVTVIPTAEAAGVRLAMHPDDPPRSPLFGYARIMSSIESFDWLLDLHSSSMNGITLCAGCFAELGVDVTALIHRFARRIHFVHLRNIRGVPDDFIETFPDDGDLKLDQILRALQLCSFDGYVRPDHAPRLACEPSGVEGYGFQGHLLTIGYLRGILDTIGSDAGMRRI